MNNRTPLGVRAHQSRSYAELEAIAATIRSKLSCPPERPIDGLQFFDQINSVEVTSSSFGHGARGCDR